jgi:hypothetical protein
MKRKTLFSILLVFLLAACSFTSPNPPTSVPTINPPDLVVDSIDVGNEQVYPYYLPLAMQPDIAPQTINDITAMIDWVYVDESRVALQYTISNLDWPDGVMLDATSVQVSSTTIENIGYGGGGGGNLPVDKGVIIGYLDQLLVDGTLYSDEHPIIDLSVDVPVNGTTAMPPTDPVTGQQLAPQESLSLPDIGTFHFQLTTPVYKGIRFVNMGQTVVANDVSMTLKSLVLNPSRAEAVICFQMPSAKDWGLTASTINIGGRDYRFSGGGQLPGMDGKEFSLTDPERCSSVGFDVLYDKSATSISLTVPKLMASLPESIDKEHVNIANLRLADRGIEFDYVPVEHGANIVILKRPEGVPDMGIYPLIWEALADQYEGPWVFQIEIKQ